MLLFSLAVSAQKFPSVAMLKLFLIVFVFLSASVAQEDEGLYDLPGRGEVMIIPKDT